MNRAFIFPGQGSQVIGMGLDFYNNFSVAKATFQQVDDILNRNLSDIIFNGSDEELTLTSNTQPALMSVSLAIVNILKSQLQVDFDNVGKYVAGHSLGEYSALCAVEAINLEDTVKLLQLRGSSMQESCAVGVGGMAACIGIELNELEEIILKQVEKGVCQIANDNIAGQIVISGHLHNIEHIIIILKERGYKAVKLKVSAPFHCSLMQPTERKMAEAIGKTDFFVPKLPIISNITAIPTTNPNEIKQNLITQICNKVRWRETIDYMIEAGIKEIVEIGSGKVLTSMVKRIYPTIRVINISNINELDQFLDSIVK